MPDVRAIAPEFAELHVVHMVIQRRWVDAELLTREDLQDKLCRLRDAAALIITELYSPSVRDFLRWAPFHASFSDSDLKEALQTMSGRIDVALRSEALVVAPGRMNKGPGPARAPMRPPPQIFVTVVVAEMWGHFPLGTPGAPRKKNCGDRRQALVLAGGAPHSGGDKSLAVWGPRFVKVRNRSSDPHVEEVFRNHPGEDAGVFGDGRSKFKIAWARKKGRQSRRLNKGDAFFRLSFFDLSCVTRL